MFPRTCIGKHTKTGSVKKTKSRSKSESKMSLIFFLSLSGIGRWKKSWQNQAYILQEKKIQAMMKNSQKPIRARIDFDGHGFGEEHNINRLYRSRTISKAEVGNLEQNYSILWLLFLGGVEDGKSSRNEM